MTTKRLAILFVFVLAGFSIVFLLPKSAAQPYGVKMELLGKLGDWMGEDEEILQKERDTLGKGTEFARKRYVNDFVPDPRIPGRTVTYGMLVSMVLSGRDMSTSIHRPERCLDAQGWIRLGSDEVAINIPG